MEIRTDSGILDTERLPGTYEPCFCAMCGCRIGWKYEETDNFIGLCDDCAAIVSQDNDKDPIDGVWGGEVLDV